MDALPPKQAPNAKECAESANRTSLQTRGARSTTMSLLSDCESLVHDHRRHGGMSCDATEPIANGYLLTVACACGVVFDRWVTPEEADADLLRLAALN